jgi:hypothetical protein
VGDSNRGVALRPAGKPANVCITVEERALPGRVSPVKRPGGRSSSADRIFLQLVQRCHSSISNAPSGLQSQHRQSQAHTVFLVSGHTVVITSATAIPSDTSRNRCHAAIQAACARGTSRMMLNVIAANR